MNDALVIILMIALVGLAILVIPRWRIKRAIPQVIQMFRDNNAIGIKNAKAEEELGFKRRSLLDGVFMPRDYKPHALTTLIRMEIIQMTEDGKLYLSEEKLADSGFSKPQPYFR